VEIAEIVLKIKFISIMGNFNTIEKGIPLQKKSKGKRNY